jgi:hypothetical protein
MSAALSLPSAAGRASRRKQALRGLIPRLSRQESSIFKSSAGWPDPCRLSSLALWRSGVVCSIVLICRSSVRSRSARRGWLGNAPPARARRAFSAEPTDRPLNFILVAAVRCGHHHPHGELAPRDRGDGFLLARMCRHRRSAFGPGKGPEVTAMMLSGPGLPEVVCPSPRSVDPASMLFGFRLTGSAVFGRPVAKSLGTDVL